MQDDPYAGYWSRLFHQVALVVGGAVLVVGVTAVTVVVVAFARRRRRAAGEAAAGRNAAWPVPGSTGRRHPPPWFEQVQLPEQGQPFRLRPVSSAQRGRWTPGPPGRHR